VAYATAQDIEDRLGRELDESEATIVNTRLEDAEELIYRRIPDLAQRVDDGKIRERLIVMVECEAVMRLIRNPEGYTQETDGNYSYSIDSRVASGRLSILPEEWALLGVARTIGVISPRIRCSPGVWKLNPNWSFEAGPDAALMAYVTSVDCCHPDGHHHGHGDDLDTAVWG